MVFIDPVVLGFGILLLLGVLVVVKQRSTGSVLDKPGGNAFVQFVNIYNLFFLLIVNPFAAVGLIARSLPRLDPTHITIDSPLVVAGLDVFGLLLYVGGFCLMGWALLRLGRNYQLGGSAPRAQDEMVTDGPYGLIRHPMYTAALSICLGLACLLQSWGVGCVFIVYLVLILAQIHMEERELQIAYADQYLIYQRMTKMLVPFVY